MIKLNQCEKVRLRANYLAPAKLLIQNNTNGSLYASCLILLCLMEYLANEKKSSFGDYWLKLFGPKPNAKRKKPSFELYPDKPIHAPQIVWAVFRCNISHNGGLIKTDKRKFRSWANRRIRFVVVARPKNKRTPVFCLYDQVDGDGTSKLILDVGIVLKKLTKILT